MVEPQSTKIDHIKRILASLYTRLEEQKSALEKISELEATEGLDERVKEVLGDIKTDLGNAERSQRELDQVKQKIEDMRVMVYPAREVDLAFAVIQNTEKGRDVHSMVSLGYEKLTGYMEHELQTVSWRMIVPKDDARAFIGHYKKRRDDPSLPSWYRLNIVRKDNTKVPVRAGLVMKTRDGSDLTYNGKKAAVVYLVPIDEIEKLERKLSFATHLKSTIDAFIDTVGELCHDINQPLTGLHGLLSLHSFDELEKAPQLGNAVRSEVNRLFDLIQELNTFALRRPTEEAGYTDISRMLVEDIFPGFKSRCEESGISLQYEMDPGCVAFVKRRGLSRAFCNVLENAYEAIVEAEDKGIKCDSEHKGVYVTVKKTSCDVVIDITDTGVGNETLKGGGTAELRIFQPHYSTKGNRGKKVTGLGLAVAYSMVKENNGDILGISEGAGRGTTFRITIPYKTRRNIPEPDGLADSINYDPQQ